MLNAAWIRRVAMFAMLAALPCVAQTTAQHITTEKEFFGFTLGDDYHLANYTQSVGYWKKLATETDRMKLVDIGPTSENRTQVMAIITSPENMKKLDHYKEIARKLALADGLTPEQAKALVHEGKSIVWIDGGLHSNEVVGQTQIVDLVYHLVNDTDAETMRELNDDIVLCVIDNPDGVEMIADWYMRDPIPAPRRDGDASAADPGGNSSFGVPHLWSHYAGHDDNRDFFMANLRETTNIDRVLFREWYPQIMYNHHQTGPVGTVIFVPPFRDPFNYHYDPLMPIKIEEVGMAIHNRLIEEGKPGSTMRSGATYSTWYNGGLRTVTYFHNMIGILTEIIGSPIPGPLPLVPNEQLARNDLPDPIAPQVWHFSQSIAYELTNNRAILDYASRNREELLFDEYRMASNAIRLGSEDSWTVTPKRIAALEDAAKKKEEERVAAAATANPGAAGRGRAGAGNGANAVPGAAAVPTELYSTVLHDPAFRDPRGYIVPNDQADFSTATKFINTLLKNGVTVLRASADFTVAGKKYPKDSYVVKTAQAYRPHILDMFEPQDHPDDFKYPGGPPIPPYDVTGYTLALQMGVQFDRVMDAFDGPFVPIATELASPPAGAIAGGKGHVVGYLVSHEANDSFILTNRLLKAKLPVFWVKEASSVEGKELGAGALWIPDSASAKAIVETATAKLGVTAYALTAQPKGAMLALKAPRIALYDQYGGLMPTGWTRYELEQFEFPYSVVYPQELDAGKLHDKYDVLILPDGAVSATLFAAAGANRGGFGNRQPAADKVPADVRPLLGLFSKEKTVPQLDAFVKDGGEIITIGGSNRLSELLSLPVRSALMETGPDGKERELPAEKFYIPGSLIKAQVDPNNAVGYGMPAKVDVFFDRSPAFQLDPDAGIKGASVIAWYGRGDLLASGWAWGQHYLQDSLAAVRIPDGKGSVILLGPEVMFRGQPHATFKLLFNGVLLSAALPAQ